MRTSSLGTLALVQAPGTSAHSSPRRLHAHSPNTTHTYTSDLLLSVFERGPFEPRTAHLLYDSLNPKRPRLPKTPSPPPRSKIYIQKRNPRFPPFGVSLRLLTCRGALRLIACSRAWASSTGTQSEAISTRQRMGAHS